MLHRRIFIDPDGTLPDYVLLIMRAPTGIIYEQQCGGTATRQLEAEGFLVPVADVALPALRALFEGTFHGTGTWNYRWPDAEISRLRDAVASIPYWTETGDRTFLRLDEPQLADADEAWIPVLTPDGPAILTWPNSD
jgi:hypothetical protein